MFKFSYSSGLSFARGTDIDVHISEEQRKKLYAYWQSNWPEPLEFKGGIKGITCEMVLEVPEQEFLKVLGKTMGSEILAIAKNNAGR